VANANPGDSLEGDFIQAFGIFAAAPVVASILSMVNDTRIMVGKKPIGFINPTVSLFFFV
jgi:tripeptidyl-peptidase-1